MNYIDRTDIQYSERKHACTLSTLTELWPPTTLCHSGCKNGDYFQQKLIDHLLTFFLTEVKKNLLNDHVKKVLEKVTIFSGVLDCSSLWRRQRLKCARWRCISELSGNLLHSCSQNVVFTHVFWVFLSLTPLFMSVVFMYVNVCVRLCIFMRFPMSYCAFSELIL